MSLSIGIVGLPNVGKSTLFNALTDNNILAANYPFATIEPNTGIVPIPDKRLVKLAQIYDSQKIVPATVTFIDIAGLVAGASKGEGLGNQFLANIRNTSVIAHIVRAFSNDDVVHIETIFNPKRDIEIINTELILADLQTIEKRLPKLAKEAKSNSKLKNQAEKLQLLHNSLNEGKLASSILTPAEIQDFEDLHLLTVKPVIYVFNVDEETLNNQSKKDNLAKLVAPAQHIFICASLEDELKTLNDTDKQELLDSYGIKSSGLTQLIHSAYWALGLQSYLTAGIKEVRAWTIKQGSTAPQAAGVIHSDFERGFISAQIVSYSDLIKAGSEASAKSAGKMRTEGKNYIMQPDDIVEFRFNV